MDTIVLSGNNTKIKNPNWMQRQKLELGFKIGHYRKGFKKKKSLTTEITSVEQGTLKTFLVRKKLNTLLNLADPTLLENSTVSLRASELDKLQGITGVGPKKAADLYDKHNMKLEDLLEMVKIY